MNELMTQEKNEVNHFSGIRVQTGDLFYLVILTEYHKKQMIRSFTDPCEYS